MKKIYSHPLLASIWLGLENSTSSCSDKRETEYLELMLACTHYESEIPEQFCQLLDFIKQHFDVDELYTFVKDVDAGMM